MKYIYIKNSIIFLFLTCCPAWTQAQMAVPDSIVIRLYNQMLQEQHTSIDRQVMLRQKLRYADDITLALFKTKDSLLTYIAKVYERPPAQRPDVSALEKRVAGIEQDILTRVQRGNAYFMALSVEFARQVYEHDPTLRALSCYTKIKAQKGSSELADVLYRYAVSKEKTLPRWQQVRDALGEQEVAVGFVIQQGFYGALLLRYGDTAPRYVPLCAQSALDEVLDKGRLEEEAYQFNLYQPIADGAPTLYELLWKPLESAIGDRKRVFYAPVGDLHRLNVGAISPKEGEPPLLDRYELVRINSMRSLIDSYAQESSLPAIQMPCSDKIQVPRQLIARFFGSIEVDFYDANLAEAANNAVLFGNIHYDMDSVAIKNMQPKVQALTSAPSKNTNKRQLGKGMANWEPLDGTKAEIEAIKIQLTAAQYKVDLWEGYAGSEAVFRQLGKKGPSPRLVHIATHGFFLADTTTGKYPDHPMNRSGLILAGANHAWKKGKPLTGMDDGILTAFEIGMMNLDQTELVVLSACETGLGYIGNSEGVFGLQRAFRQAGVKNLVVSLWSIPDNATRMLMERFYQHCIVDDMTIRDALYAAQRWMRAQEQYANPYFWAGFVLLE